jgi:hypothetical protein
MSSSTPLKKLQNETKVQELIFGRDEASFVIDATGNAKDRLVLEWIDSGRYNFVWNKERFHKRLIVRTLCVTQYTLPGEKYASPVTYRLDEYEIGDLGK